MTNQSRPTGTDQRYPSFPLSKVLATACLFIAVVLPLATLYTLIRNPKDFPGAGESPLLPWQIAVAAFISMFPVGFVTYGLACAHRCFRAFAHGGYFQPATVQHLRGFATGIFASGIAALFVPPLVSLALTLGNPVGKRSLVMTMDSHEIFLILFAGILWQIATVLSKAVTLAEENAQFI